MSMEVLPCAPRLTGDRGRRTLATAAAWGWAMRIGMMAAGLAMVLAGPAFGWQVPARGTALRAALMDAARPHAEWDLGPPVEFVVDQLRVAGNVAFAALRPQRPGGGQIDLRMTPLVYRDGNDPQYMDGTHMEVLYQRTAAGWVAVAWQIGSTDVWYATPEICARFRPVIPEICTTIGQ